MNLSKRNFLKNLGFAGVATVATITSASGEEKKVGAKTSTVFNVKDFGAKGDGKTPDSQAIQKALDAAGTVSGTVYFPSGKYLCHDLKVSEHTTLLSEPQWAYGMGDEGAMLYLDSEEASCVLDITGAFGAHIRGLVIRGIRNAKKEIHGIFLNNDKEFSKKEDSIVIDDTKVQNFSGHGICLLRIWLFIIRHSFSRSNGKCGVYICGWDGFVTDNQFSDNGLHGFGADTTGATVMFTANRVEWNKGCGISLVGGDAWNISGNCFDCNWGPGVSLNGIRQSTVISNVFRRCGREDKIADMDNSSCQIALTGCNGVSVTGNACGAGKKDGGKGEVRPRIGIKYKKISYCVISSNVMAGGYTDEMFMDEGSNGEQVVLSNNAGSKAAK